MTARQAAELLITSPRTVYRLIDSAQGRAKGITRWHFRTQ
ncbi:helix-turn-helix domain-containing protein [Enterobacter hormaechei]